jgi:DNA-binding NtrC family response regulator
MGTTMLEPPALRDPSRPGRDTAAEPAPVTDPLSLGPDTKASIQVLIIDDERTLRESCASMLKHAGFNVRVCRRGDEALDTLKRSRFDIVLLDLYMSQVPGMELLRAALETYPETIVIVMTGQPSVTSNLEALQAGAWDYLPKPFSATHLQILLGRAAHAVIVARETRVLQAGAGGQNGKSDKIKLIGVAPAFRRVIELARQVAETDASVFITGESGVGKEQIAQFIHHHGRRSSRPW